MDAGRVTLLAVVAFVSAALGAITGSTSLVTVPAMIFVGMDPKTAVGTNMLTLVFLSAGATFRFQRAAAIVRHPTTWLSVVSVPGSLLGALIAVSLRAAVLRTVIAAAVVAMALVLAASPDFGESRGAKSRAVRITGYAVAAAWAIYGGLFSGGYATVLTFACVAFFGTTLVDGIALTKPVNLVGSIVAAAVFAYEGRIDVTVGGAMSAAALLGGWAGADLVISRGATWALRIFAAVVLILGAKLLYDALSA